MVVLKLGKIALIITMVIISSLIVAISAYSSSYILNAARALPDSVSQGDSFEVIVNFTAPAEDSTP